MYTPLGVKTDYSLLQSLIKIEDYLSYAKKNGYTCLGILDDSLCSAHAFYEACKKANMKCVIGLDIIIEETKMYLYPKNWQGLTNLFKLTKKGLEVDLKIEDLKAFKEEIICVLPYESYSLYDKLDPLFQDCFLSFLNKEEEIEAKMKSKHTLYLHPIYALNSDSAKYINYLHMIDKNLKLGDMELKNYQDYVLKEEEIDNTYFTNLIHIEYPKGNRYIPHYDASIIDSNLYLKELASKGLKKRLGGVIPKLYQDRLAYELDVITKMGFTDYFLIVLDYVRFAIKNNILVGAGRGSAVGSLVAYSLGITWIDPLKYNLLFERFLNPERITMPDIDIDFVDNRKDEVIDYVRKRYGENRVAKIMTYGTMTAKEVLRTVGKINDVSENTMNSLLKLIDSKASLSQNKSEAVNALLNRNSSLHKVYTESMVLEGLKKHIGTGAAGVVVSSEDLEELIPLIKSGEEYITGITKDEVEDLGLLKMDFLSIRNLTLLSNVLEDIEKVSGKKININTLPLDDKATYDLFRKADTVGIFQFESVGLRNFLKRLQPTCFEDLVVCLALYRPGPMQFIDTFLSRKNGKEKVEHIDESLKFILESTYGIIVYQEQIMEILRFMANYSYAEADIVRRAISKKKHEVLEAEKSRFIEKSVKNGYQKEKAEEVFALIVRFADYGFNKSHSVAYAFIGYQMAYLKVHFKEIFYIELLNANVGGEAKTKEYIDEAKKSGIKVLKPDINLSTDQYESCSEGIRLPLRTIKGLGIASSDAILSKRGNEPFVDFFDFIGRCYGFNVNKKTLECLILSGALDAFGYNRATLLKNIASSITYAELIRDLDDSLVSKPEIIEVPELPEIDLMNKELELFGYFVSTHPASKYPDAFKQIDIAAYFDKRIETVVLLEAIKKIMTKNNKEMAFIKASDETLSGEFTLFPDKMQELKGIKVGDLVRIKGHVEKRYANYQIIIQSIEKI